MARVGRYMEKMLRTALVTLRKEVATGLLEVLNHREDILVIPFQKKG